MDSQSVQINIPSYDFMSNLPVESDEPAFEGTNTLQINMATMIKAVEFWLNQLVFQDDVTVKSVTNRDGMFTVVVEPKEGE